MMFFKKPFNKNQKSVVLFALQITFLIFSLILVLWGQKKLKTNQPISKNSDLERKARFITPDKE